MITDYSVHIEIHKWASPFGLKHHSILLGVPLVIQLDATLPFSLPYRVEIVTDREFRQAGRPVA